MAGIRIAPFDPGQAAQVLELILGIQQGEFQVPITAADQPDLGRIPEVYQRGRGQFWVGLAGHRVVGTLGLLDFGSGGALRKMFVHPDHRGTPSRLGQTLLDTLLAHAREQGLPALWLGTLERMGAARRFYERNGFRAVEPANLPPDFPRMAVDTRFYTLDLGRGPAR